MRTEVRICFDVAAAPGGAWPFLAQAGCGPDVAEVDDEPVLGVLDAWITLEETDGRLPLLCELLRRHQMTWLEWHQDRYTEPDLESARLLMMHPGGQCEIDGGVKWGTTFDLSGACPACATGCRQTSALFVNGNDIPLLEGHRAAQTYFWHILVDERLAAALEDAAPTGLSFRSVYAVMPDKRQVKLRWNQLCAENVLPRMSPSTTGLERHAQTKTLRPCEVCQRNGYVVAREAPARVVYRAVDLHGALDVNCSWENHWSAHLHADFRESLLSRPWLIVTPKVRRVFRDAGVTEFDWLPVRVEDGDGEAPPGHPGRA